MAEEQAGDHDRDHPGGVDPLRSDVRSERRDEAQPAVQLGVGDVLADEAHDHEGDQPDEHTPAGGDDEVLGHALPADGTAIAAIDVRRATSAVASLSSDSPSRMVTIRRGRPMRRPMAVAATASGGATTAPIAKHTAHLGPANTTLTVFTLDGANATSPAARARSARSWAGLGRT